jgi:hypothetical protein
MNTNFHNLRTKLEDARIQDEIITAKGIRKDHPELTWTEALRLAKQTWDKVPLV